MVRIGNSAGSQQVAVSSDGGATWNIHYGAGTTQYGGTVAYSADADTVLWSSSNAGVLRSQNQGTFTAVASLPSSAVIAADKRNNTVFYASSGSSFYRSVDTGSTFTTVGGALAGAASVRDIAAHPKVAGEVWVSTDVGMFKSTDHGATFAQVGAGAVSDAQQIALGLGSGSTWNVYVFGHGSAGARLYASGDGGATWTDVQGVQGFGAISSCRVAGSGNVAGQVYVGTNGRGVFYAKGVVVAGRPTGATTSSASALTKPSRSSSSKLKTRTSRGSASAATTTAAA